MFDGFELLSQGSGHRIGPLQLVGHVAVEVDQERSVLDRDSGGGRFEAVEVVDGAILDNLLGLGELLSINGLQGPCQVGGGGFGLPEDHAAAPPFASSSSRRSLESCSETTSRTVCMAVCASRVTLSALSINTGMEICQ